jgi:glycosyltransferase involved in cell wall biosynthesis
MRAGVREHIHLLDPAPPDDLERLGSAYDLGFVGEMPGTRNRQIALTNKMFSYVIGGVPSIASDVPAHRHIAPEFGAAMSLFRSGDATALASVIDSYLLNPDRLAAARLHAWTLGQKRFNWEQESHAFLALVEHALTRPSIPEGGVPA